MIVAESEQVPLLESDPSPAEARGDRRISTIVLVLWCALATGFIELAIFAARNNIGAGGHVRYGMSRHFPWMIPGSSLMIFAAFSLVIAGLARVHRRLAATARNYGLLFLSSLTILLTIRGLNAPASLLFAGGVAARGMPWVRPEGVSRRLRTVVRRTFPWLAATWVGLVAWGLGTEAWSEFRAIGSLPNSPKDAPNILLVVMDTVRADHLSTYGYSRGTTPNLTRLAARGVKFDRATTTAPWTLPAHASMFTGRWPHETATLRGKPLESGIPTLAEFLASRGYATGGFVANHFNCSRESGLSRGFAHYEDYEVSVVSTLGSSGLGWLCVKAAALVRTEYRRIAGLEPSLLLSRGFQRKDAPRINEDALRWVDANRGRPFFAFLNYFDAHDPYLLPEGVDHHFGLKPTTRAETDLLRDWIHVEKGNLTERQVTLALDSYDDCIAYLDDHLGQLFDELDRRDLSRDTVVVVTSDHGEHFGEHGLFGHGVSLYQGEIRVPLLVVDPRSAASAGTVHADPVSLRDLPMTLADLAGLDASGNFPGSSLAGCWKEPGDSRHQPSEAVLSEVEESGLIKATHGHLARIGSKSISEAEGVYHRLVDGSEQFFDVGRDPLELRDLSPCPNTEPALLRSREALDLILRGEEGSGLE
ncbi:sulfatase [Singulisphaera sp. PoT]|uniref:sulfatase n=1 Tax=Singulisphaera sp. PoT TaxID=3411797 RepID=UPI003BF5C32B